MCLAQERSDANEARTRNPLVSSKALHRRATALPQGFFFINSLVFVLNMLKVRAVGRRSMRSQSTHWRCHCDAAEMLAIVLRASRRSAFFLDAVRCLVFVMLSRLSIAALWSLLPVRLEPTAPQSRLKHPNTEPLRFPQGFFFCMNSLV